VRCGKLAFAERLVALALRLRLDAVGLGRSPMRIVGIVALGAALAGCAGDAIKTGMNNLQGQPISAAIAKLGIPNDEREIAGQKVYTWYSSTFDEGTQLQCKIRVMMAGDVIGSYEFDGNNNMCMRYANKLRS
jgi:hypothetical protein